MVGLRFIISNCNLVFSKSNIQKDLEATTFKFESKKICLREQQRNCKNCRNQEIVGFGFVEQYLYLEGQAVQVHPDRKLQKSAMFRKKRQLTAVATENLLAQQQASSYKHFKSQQNVNINETTRKQNEVCEITDNSPTFSYENESPTVPEANDSDEEDELSYQATLLKKRKQKAEITKLANKKMAIGSGFNLDMSDFFKFKTKKKTQGYGLSRYVTGGHLTWIILFYYVCNSAIMPAWIMSIKANKILRISWRFLFQAIFMIPFVLYERRTGDQDVKRKYQWSYIFNFDGLRKVYLSSLGTSIWFTIILTCFQWTYISHSLMMGSLSNFFLSLSRSFSLSAHPLQPGGQIFVVIGILFTIFDSYMLNVQQLSTTSWDVINPYYLTRQPYQRVIADVSALTGAFILSVFSQKAADLKTYYPPFLSILMVNVFVAIQVGLSAYFINGATFDRDTNLGVLGILTDANFGAFFYIAVILSFGTLVSFLLISKMFASPIIPALAMTLEPFFATFFLNLVGIQTMPGSFTIYGYIFLICGLFLILIGQFMLQRQKQETQQQAMLEKEMKEKLFLRLEKIGHMEQIKEDQNEQQHKNLHMKDKGAHHELSIHSDIIHR